MSPTHTQIKKIWHLVQEMPTQRALIVSLFLLPHFFPARKFISANPVLEGDADLDNAGNFWPKKSP